ncbi:DNA/RNA non-specific endonuclease [Arthrobacter sp. B1805]|uniref:DNA/RNA non-specific endonuclease n=1 Tax=Arthrobacter sp. B1805 TaxID=2058892 RepID=UPI000CE30534|nr:DNA/RNA non-specific endonuclease [Arthrobacter sp. B1805]
MRSSARNTSWVTSALSSVSTSTRRTSPYTRARVDRSGIDWRLDPRLPEDQQTGERAYARNDIDRGHLGRRASAVWGDTRTEAQQANEDTFHYTNAAPQAAKFNQGLELWLGLESYLLENAADNGRRLIVFTGPIFSDVDPVYRGVENPLRYFEIAVFLQEGALAATGYVVDQTPKLAELDDVPKPGTVGDDAPPLGPFRTFQVPIRDIAALTGLKLDQLIGIDRMPITAALSSARVTSAWRELSSPECLDLDFDLSSRSRRRKAPSSSMFLRFSRGFPCGLLNRQRGRLVLRTWSSLGIDHAEQVAIWVCKYHEVRTLGILPLDTCGAK